MAEAAAAFRLATTTLSWHHAQMRPSRRALFDRLKEREGARTDAELAQKLGISERKFYRWKGGAGMTFEETIELLERAGALKWN